MNRIAREGGTNKLRLYSAELKIIAEASTVLLSFIKLRKQNVDIFNVSWN